MKQTISQATQVPLHNTLIRKPFYFIRHGTTQWNLEGRLTGISDIPLHQTGREQALAAQKLVESLPITHIFYSPLNRTTETMHILSERVNCPKTAHPLITERNYGSYEGKVKHEIPDAIKLAFGLVPEHTTEFTTHNVQDTTMLHDGELEDQFYTRILAGMNDILTQSTTPLIVAHGGVYGALCHLAKTPNFFLKNSKVVQFTPSDKGTSWNITEIQVLP